MDKWIKYRKGHANIAYIPDIIIASILRLIGELSFGLNFFLTIVMWGNKCIIKYVHWNLFIITNFVAIRVDTFALNSVFLLTLFIN